jgi:glyceraldehyde-3-phosphate dehydrogenase (NADP+)
MSEFLLNVFPEESAIPQQFRIQQPIEQRQYLINGEMKTWEGNLNPVQSPVFVKEGNSFRQKTIGSTPLLTTKESMEALDVKCDGQNRARGEVSGGHEEAA